MYYIYFTYVLILSSLIFVECIMKSKPRWWAALVLAAPVTAPYFLFKSRKENSMVLILIFLSTFSAVGASEFILYSRYMEKNKYADLPPVTRQMIRLTDKLKISTAKLDNGLVKLEQLSKVESRIHEIKKTIDFIHTLRGLRDENQNDIDLLIKYTTDYQSFFKKKELDWVFNLQKFYNNRNVRMHYRSLQKYLDSFEELLRYTYVNFYNITDHKSEEHLKNYDQYYLRYRRSVDSHNRFNVKRIEYQNTFLEEYPKLRIYLPGARQTDTFKLWG